MLAGPFLSFTQHGSLLVEMVKRDVLGRYRGANFGLLWALLSPFLMLVVYSMAFGFVFKSKWPHVVPGHASFALILYIGLIVHGFFAECIIRAPQIVSGNPNFVKRLIFPLEVLPWTIVLSALFHALINLFVFVVLYAVLVGVPPWTVLLFPLVLLPLVILAIGISWILASLGVYIRDISQVTSVITTAMLFLSSAIVPVDAIPESYRIVFKANPLTFIIDQAREVTLWGEPPNWAGLLTYVVVATFVMYAGYMWFRATRAGFADVL